MQLVRFNDPEYEALAVREKPDPSARMVARIYRGATFEATEPVDGWRKTGIGYVNDEFVSVAESPETAREPEEATEAPKEPPKAENDAQGNAEKPDLGELAEMKIGDLRRVAERLGIALKVKMTKDEIIQAIIDG